MEWAGRRGSRESWSVVGTITLIIIIIKALVGKSSKIAPVIKVAVDEEMSQDESRDVLQAERRGTRRVRELMGWVMLENEADAFK